MKKTRIILMLIFCLTFGISNIYLVNDVHAETTSSIVDIRKAVPSVNIEANNNSLKLSWSKINGATKYEVQRSTKKDSGFKKIATVEKTSYKDTKLKYGTKYYYKVIAVNNKYKTAASKVVSKKVVPNTVTDFKASAKANVVNLSWKKVAVDGYVIQRSTDNKKWTTIKTIKNSKTTTYKDTNLKTNKKYYYRIRAYSKKVYGSYANLTTKTAPKAPNVTLSIDEDEGFLTVQPSNVSSATKYQIYRSTNNKKYTKVATLLFPTKYTDNDVIPGKKYYYKVRTCNSYNACGNYSKVQSIKNKELEAPTKIYTTNRSEYISLTWDYDATATGFQIQKSTDNKKWSKNIDLKESSYYSEKSVKNVTKYYYKIRKYKVVNNKKYYSKYATITIDKKVPNVKDLKATPADTGIKISWKNQGWDLIYELYRSTSKDGEYVRVNEYTYADYSFDDYENGLLSYIDKNLKANKTYYYKIRFGYYENDKIKYGKYASVSAKTQSSKKAKVNVKEQALNIISKDVGYSKTALIDSLVYLGYSKDVAKYGAENSGINYKKEALKRVNNYIKYDWYPSEKILRQDLTESNFSKAQINYAIKNSNIDFVLFAKLSSQYSLEYGVSEATLRSDLEYKGFTKAQINSAVKSIDFNNQAVLAAKSIIKYSNFGPTQLRDYLVNSYKFTKKQANYAINNAKINFVTVAKKHIKESEQIGSKKFIVNNMKSYGFTEQDITSAIEQLKIDFNKRALDEAKSILSYVTYSKDELKNELTKYYYYTEAEANYAVSKLDFKTIAKNYALELYNDDFIKYSESSLRAMLKELKYSNDEINYAMSNNNFNFDNKALEHALDLLNEENSYFSRKDMVETLKYSGFTDDNISFAIESISGDLWQTQAVRFVEYLTTDFGNYSRYTLTNYLLYEEFTEEEINNAIDSSNIDFSAQALNIARTLETYSRVDMIQYLVSEEYDYQFTVEEANFAIDNIDFKEVLKNILTNEIESASCSQFDTVDGYIEYYRDTENFTEEEISQAMEEVDFVNQFNSFHNS